MSRLSPNDIEKIIKLYKSSTPILEIAHKLNIDKWAIYYQIKINVKNNRNLYSFEKVLIKKTKKNNTEVRICNCDIQDCKGRFLTLRKNVYEVCPYEAIRKGLINNITEYFK